MEGVETNLRNETVAERLAILQQMIPEGIQLVAVSKFQPIEKLRAAYEAGQRVFGESRVMELLDKVPQLPSDISWHFIGHLQTNKVRKLIGATSLIESVDSARLLTLINDESRLKGVKTAVLLQVHVAAEETKFGFSPEELKEYLQSGGGYRNLQNIEIRGLMAMATNTDDEEVVRNDFRKVADLFREIKNGYEELPAFDTLSMGMSGDWPIAVEEGATSIRVGSAIFGHR